MPTAGKYFADPEDGPELSWVPYPLAGEGIAFKTQETLLALCELSKLFRRLLEHNKDRDMNDGSSEDVRVRVQFYRELLDLKARNPVIPSDPTDSAACVYTLVSVDIPSWRCSLNSSLMTWQVLLSRYRAFSFPSTASASRRGSAQRARHSKRPLL
jgi:hypothetical protein